MALEAVFSGLEARLRGKEVTHYVNMPALVIVDDLEFYQSMRCKYDPSEYLIVYSPELKVNKPHCKIFKAGGMEREAVFISQKDVRYAMAELYDRQSVSSGNVYDALQSLEESVQRTSAERASNMDLLGEAARTLVQEQPGQNNEQLMRLIQSITTSQFEYSEHFAREAIQNADGSSKNKAENRIDFYLDRENRTIKIADYGDGMTTDVMDTVFFNLYASLNEALNHAAGKFGIGAVSFFGLGHAYVKVDSKPRKGQGGLAIVDSQLQRDAEFAPNERTEYGTTIEIKLGADSEVDFDRIVEILEQDCSYIETPLYLHVGNSTKKLNKELAPKSNANTLSFEEDSVQGYITRASGEGTLDLLCHRIRLASIPTAGYSGAVNCTGLDTIFSRDTVLDDPVLKGVLEYVALKSRELHKSGVVSLKNASLEARLTDYHRFVRESLYLQDGSPNAQWIEDNIRALLSGGRNKKTSMRYEFTAPVSYKIGAYLASPFFALYRMGYNLATKRKLSQGVRDCFGYDLDSAGALSVSGALLLGLEESIRAMINVTEKPTLLLVAPFVYLGAIAAEPGGKYVYHAVRENINSYLVNHRYRQVARKTSRKPGVAVARSLPIDLRPFAKTALGVLAAGIVLYAGAEALNYMGVTGFPHPEVSTPAGNDAINYAAGATANRNIPYGLLLAGGAALAGSAAFYRSLAEKRRTTAKHTGALNELGQQKLDDVNAELEGLGRKIDVYYGSRLKPEDHVFYTYPSKVVLNGNRVDELIPQMVALGYATKVLKNIGLAQRIAQGVK